MLQAVPLSTEDLEFRAPIEWEERWEESLLKRFLRTWRRVLFSPAQFFENLRRRASYWQPLTFAFLMELIVAVLGGLLGGGIFSGFVIGGSGHWGVLGADFRIFHLLVGCISLALSLLGASFLCYLVAFAMGARAPYRTLFRMYAYTEGVVIFQLIPWIGILVAAVYRSVLLFYGFKTVYRFSNVRALIGAAIPGLILLILMGSGGFSFYYFLVKG